MMHSLDAYEDGMRRLLEQLGQEHRRYSEALTLQSRLRENLDSALEYGDDEMRRADRAQIISSFNRLAQETVGISFNELCEEREAEPSISKTDVRGLLEAMGYRIADSRTVGSDLYFLCDVKWGVEICREVVHFVGTEPTPGDIAALNDAVVSHDAARGVLLTRHPLPPALCELASQRKRIRCYTVDEFTDRLADFHAYLERLIQKYEASEIPAFYIPLTAESEAGENESPQIFRPLESFVDTWLAEPGRNHLSILGDFGSGKTWFCQHYAYLSAKRYLADPSHNRIPILITLRDYSRAYDVEQLITDAIANRYKVGLAAGYKTFARLNRAGRLLLIFDGFDEMERRVSDYRTTVENFWELAKVASPASKIVLTCRTAYFRHRDEEKDTLAPRRNQVSVVAGEQVIDLHDQERFEVVHLLDFDNEDIQLALQKRLSTEWELAYQKIQELSNLRDLASRPVLLDMIVKTLPDIGEAVQINQATLYKAYVNALLKRRWSEDTDYIPPQDRLFFMQELAWEMYQAQRLSISFSELPERVTAHFGLKDDPDRAAFFERDIRTQSYLVRDDSGNYRFAHKSFMEYFVACRMADVISNPDTELEKAIEVWKTQPLTSEVRGFLLPMIDSPASLWRLIEATRGKNSADVGYIGGNATRVLSAHGGRDTYRFFDFSSTVLNGADFSGQVLENVSFEKAMLIDADMTAANLSGANLQQAELQGARLTFARLVDTDMRFADLSDISLREFDQVRDVVFSPDGKVIAVAAANQVRLINWTTGDVVGSAMHSTYFRCVAFHPSGCCLIAGTADGCVMAWDVNSFAEILSLQPVRTVYSLSFAPDGKELFVGGDSDKGDRSECLILNWSDPSKRTVPKCTVEGKVRASIYSTDNQYILVGGAGSSRIEVLERTSGEKATDFSLPGSSVMSLALSTDNSLLACGCSDGHVCIFDFATGALTAKWLVEERVGRARWIWDVRYTNDGQKLVSDGPHCTVAIWNGSDGQMIALLSGHSRRLSAVALSPDSSYIASGGIDGTVRIWNIEARTLLQTFRQTMDCSGLRIQGIRITNQDLVKFLIERGAVEE
jgi:WD40 repeat protein